MHREGSIVAPTALAVHVERAFPAAVGEASNDAVLSHARAGIILKPGPRRGSDSWLPAAEVVGKNVALLTTGEQLPRLRHFTERVLGNSAKSTQELSGCLDPGGLVLKDKKR